MVDEARLELEYMAAAAAEYLRRWRPFPGPQTQAYNCTADILFYGGSAGGGKTDLLLGIARNKHYRSVIFRRVFPSLRGIIDRSRQIYNAEGAAAAADSYNEQLHRWKLKDGKQIEFGSLQYDKNVTDWQGQPHDLYGFDEITEFSEAQFRFVTGWNRTTRPGQRCRVICTGNPPTDSDGEWVIRFFAPWLDENHPNPAQPGELRWYTTVNGKDVEMPNGDPVQIEGEWVVPKSRTFIPARVQDNPTLMASGYIATLQALPEPLRSKMLYGDFRAGREDNAYQIIPTEWVRLAQERWKEREKPTTPMTTLGVDVARGGKDKTCMFPRYGNWFGEAWTYPGKATPDGPAVAGLVLQNATLGAVINVDVIGVGSSVYDFLKDLPGMTVIPINGAARSDATDKSGALSFVNLRAENWWKFREALDPASGQDIALPPDTELKADLCAPTWKLTARGIQVESKEDIIARIGRSPDKGDAAVYAHAMVSIPGTGLLEFMRQEDEARKASAEALKQQGAA